MSRSTIFFLATSSALALTGPVMAQTAPSGSANVEEVVVTGSRIQQSGYERPTPVTVIGAEVLQQSNPSSFTQAVVQLPAFMNSNSTRSSLDQSARNSASKAGAYLNMRNLGSNRNLVLQDGHRLPASTGTGQVDITIVPELLVQRVDVVTSGVSAVYGSDAVTGVVNFVLDKDFTGIKGVAQGGVSTYGDGSTWKYGVAIGHGFMDNRLHLLLNYTKSGAAGVEKISRKYVDLHPFLGPGTTLGTAGTAAAPLRILFNVGSNNAAPNGFIQTGLPGFTNLTFSNTNQIRAYDPGIRAAGNSQIGGDKSSFPAQAHMISNPYIDQGFARLSFDVTEKVNLFGEVAATRVRNDYFTNFASVRFGIQADNAFLPQQAKDALAAALAAGANPANPNPAATAQCGFGAPVIACYTRRIPVEGLPPIGTEHQSEAIDTLNYKVGASGELFEGWRFDAAFIHGKSEWDNAVANELEAVKIAAAGDSVINPATGQPVCRITLTAPTSPVAQGCVPYNWVGINVNTDAAWAYIRSTSRFKIVNTISDWMLNITGSPFSLWAGPVGVAFGGEYRKVKLSQTSNSDPNILENCTGIRVCNPSSGKFLSGNVSASFGEVTVKEANVEIEVPLAKDLPFAKAATFSGAVRYTDYSTSGTVYTWKAGGTWEPVEDVRFRLTRSRDIRAPTLFDLYSGRTNIRGVFVDPHTGTQSNTGTFVLGGGNADLKPEIANTLTYGVVFQPRFLSGFTASIDYYDIKMTDVINTLTPQQVIQLCEDSGGTGPTCASIVRPFPFSDRSQLNTAISVFAGNINAALLRTKGLDFEATYRMPLDVGWLDGDLTWHLLANRITTFKVQGFANDPIRSVLGLTGTPPANNTPTPLDSPVPKLQGSLSATYTQGPATVFLQTRMVGKLKPGPMVIVIDKLPAQYYTDFTGSYDFKLRGGTITAFVSVTNLFNQTPPLFPGSLVEGLSYPSLISIYDVMGRYYTAGVRFRF